MKKTILIFLPCIVLGSVFMISDPDINPRSSGMRNSDFAMVRNNGSFFVNPAFGALNNDMYFSSSYHKYFSDIYFAGVSYSHPDLIFSGQSSGFSLSSINYGGFSDRDTGYSYNPYEILAAFSQSYSLAGFHVGTNIKYAYSSITDEYTSSALVFDAAVLYFPDKANISFSSGIFNAGMQFGKYNTTQEEIIPLIRSGFAYGLKNIPLTAVLKHDHYLSGVNRNRLSAGLELMAKDNLVVRGGYDLSGSDKAIGTNSNKEKFAGIALGITLFLNDIDFDLSYGFNGELENEIGLSLGMNVSKITNKYGGD